MFMDSNDYYKDKIKVSYKFFSLEPITIKEGIPQTIEEKLEVIRLKINEIIKKIDEMSIS